MSKKWYLLKRKKGRPKKLTPKRVYKGLRPRVKLEESVVGGWVLCYGGYIRIGKVRRIVDRDKISEKEWRNVRWSFYNKKGIYDFSENRWSRAFIEVSPGLIFVV